jgi:N utilization substance protein B
MGRRREARQVALQYHFWRDMQRGDGPEKMDDFWEFLLAKPRVREFAQPLIDGMNAHLAEIDERIRRYTENYEFRRIAAVDRNVLRLAIYEMLFRDDIPPVVSINEAIELAKKFGGAESGRFVNGILDQVRKELTRPAREAVKRHEANERNLERTGSEAESKDPVALP